MNTHTITVCSNQYISANCHNNTIHNGNADKYDHDGNTNTNTRTDNNHDDHRDNNDYAEVPQQS